MISPAMATMLCVVTTDAVLAAAEHAGPARQGGRPVVQPDHRRRGDEHQRHRASSWPAAPPGVQPGRRGAAPPRRGPRRHAPAHGPDDGGRRRRGDQDHAADGARAPTTTLRRGTVARAIADSPLVKTAMHGGDPNWGQGHQLRGRGHGRPLAAQGQLCICAACWWCEGGAAAAVSDADDAASCTAGMKEPEIDIDLDLGLGAAATESCSSPTWATSTSPSTPNTTPRSDHARGIPQAGGDPSRVAARTSACSAARPWSSSTAARP